ncbi:MAG: hypothetical protein KAI43_08590 [Candidatus Aureabacteria bacterium]|nr:hypothetical protein [Candidatus Auribacterota bacterium]
MNIKEILEKCSGLKIHEERANSDEYIEVVVANTEIDKWHEACASLLGDAAKPAGTSPSKEVLKLTDDFGGVSRNQTLYSKSLDEGTVIAMFWPWGNGTQTTIKIARLK